MATWEELKRRKIVQWALAYLAGAWVVLDVTSLVGGHLGWPAWFHASLIVLTAVGLPLTLVLAWYHGEKGRQRVSGPELLMVMALLVVAGVGLRLVRPDASAGEAEGAQLPALPAPERSVAVLPLDGLGASAEHAFFADAMTEQITSALTAVPGLTVKSRSSAAQFTGSEMTVDQFARTIGVSHVIEGSVQRSGERVRVTVQLIDARTDDHLWAQTYDRTLTDLFDVQVEIARQVADRLATSFTERERERILAGATDDPVAYDLFLQSLGSPMEPDRRVELLRRAVESDPTFWPAWEALASLYLVRESQGGGEWADSARAAYRRAFDAADHSSARVRLQAVQAMIFGGDEEEATARLRAAVEERPSDVRLVAELGQLLRIRGRLPEAVRWLRQAASLDPLQPSRWQALFAPYWWVGLYERAERVVRRALELDPRSTPAWHGVAWLRMGQNRIDEALAAVDSAEAFGSRLAPLHRGFLHWWAGDVEEAGAAYRAVDLSTYPNAPEYQLIPMAHALFALGDSTEARRIVERVRGVIESRVIADYEPEWRVFPRLQLAAIDGDLQESVALFRRYVERGGRDYRWFERSPLFEALRDEPAFRRELEQLARMVEAMKRQMERDLPPDP